MREEGWIRKSGGGQKKGALGIGLQSHMSIPMEGPTGHLSCSDLDDLPVNKVRCEAHEPFATLLLWLCGEKDVSVRRVRVSLFSLEGKPKLTLSPWSYRRRHCWPVSFLLVPYPLWQAHNHQPQQWPLSTISWELWPPSACLGGLELCLWLPRQVSVIWNSFSRLFLWVQPACGVSVSFLFNF